MKKPCRGFLTYAAYIADIRATRRKLHICLTCPTRVTDTIYCKDCLKKQRVYKKRYRSRSGVQSTSN